MHALALTPSAQQGAAQFEPGATLAFDFAGSRFRAPTTNLVARSQEFDQSNWSKRTSYAVTADQIAAPDGTQTADLITNSGNANVNEGLFANNTVAGNGTFTFSIWLRAGTATAALIEIKDASSDVVRAQQVLALTTTWQRFSITATTAGATAGFRAEFSSNGVSGTIYAWGAQVEAGQSATGYVPTGAGGVTSSQTIGSLPALTSISGITVSRASVGYAEKADGTLVQFAPNVARITDKGLLVEEARTNLMKSSASIGDGNWNKDAGLTVTANAATAPDGTTTASLLDFGGGTATACYQTSVTVAASTYTASVWLRANAPGTIVLGEAASVAGTQTVNVTTAWQRFTVPFAAVNTGDGMQIRRTGAGQLNQVYAWGAQFELGAFATSYIPTTSASATRAADAISLAGLTAAASDFTLVMSAGGTPSSGFPAILRYENADASNAALFYENGVSGWLDAKNAGVTSSHQLATGLVLANPYAAAVSRVVGSAPHRSVNGAAGGVVPNGGGSTVPSIATDLMRLAFSTTPYDGFIRKVVIYPRAFSDAELQAATS